MIVVADSSPLVVLVQIGLVHVLPGLFGRAIIPPEVAAEVAAPNRPESVRAFMATPPAWLEIRPAANIKAIDGLHAGEIAAIALAGELDADLLIIDERQGRQAASQRRIRFIGTIGLLELAAEQGLIELGPAFAEIKQTDFWVSSRFLDERFSLFEKRMQAQEPDQKVQDGPAALQD